jgi:hypothetical protein
LILCLLNLTKNEILWYFRHKGKKAKKKIEEPTENNLSELLFLMDNMVQFATKYKSIVSEYHSSFLKGLYLKKIKGLKEKLDNSFKFEDKVNNLIQLIISDISNETNFTQLRLNWKKALILMSDKFAKEIKGQDATLIDFLTTMNKISQITKNIDEIDSQLKNASSLKELYFNNDAIQANFKNSLISNDESPLFCLSFIELLNHYQDNASLSFPGFRKEFGLKIVELSINMINELSNYIIKRFDNLVKKHEEINRLISGVTVGKRIKAKISKEQGKNSS